MENRLQKLLEIASLKLQRDKTGTWSNGSVTYFEAIYDELEEVKAEIKDGRECYLEDELGDVLWDFICMLKHLEDERKINLENVFERSVKKYSERISGIGAGESWDEIKEIQRHELAVEHEMNCKKNY
jgi:NTP pyrophosphatase (non-canonical NTP hydrolase)